MSTGAGTGAGSGTGMSTATGKGIGVGTDTGACTGTSTGTGTGVNRIRVQVLYPLQVRVLVWADIIQVLAQIQEMNRSGTGAGTGPCTNRGHERGCGCYINSTGTEYGCGHRYRRRCTHLAHVVEPLCDARDEQVGCLSRVELAQPMNRDERHNVNASVNVNFASGKKYNGPSILGNDILSNTGINVNFLAVSGRPYTKELVPDVLDSRGLFGALNGARLPWSQRVNFRINKYIPLHFGKKKGEVATKPIGMNVYLRIQNLFDQKNIINVYKNTGSASDDGYLASTFGENIIRQTAESGQSVESFLDAYQWRALNGTFFALPRRMFLGANISF